MFGSRKSQQPETGKIRLPKASVAPGMKDIAGLKVQAEENRNREIELTWQEPGSPKTSMLTVKMAMGPVEPLWVLLEDDGKETKVVCEYQTSEAEMIYDFVCMAYPSAGSAGAGAAAPGAAAPAVAAGAGVGQPVQTGQHQQQQAQSPWAPGATAAGAAPQQHQQQYGAPGAAPTAQQQYGAPPAQQQQQGGSPSQAPPQMAAGGGSGQTGQFGAGGGGASAGGGSGSYPQQIATNDPASSRFASVERANERQGYTAEFARVGASMQGNLDDIKIPALLQGIVSNGLSGKLEVRGEESVGEVYFTQGNPTHAATPSAYGDGAIRELVTWEKGLYAFYPQENTDMRSVQGRLQTTLSEGQAMLDQKRHLKMAGLSYESYLIRKHKNLSETELKLMLTKGAPIDFGFQKKIYDYLRHKRTFIDLLRDHPMDSTMWTSVLFNFISCGLIDIKPPETVRGGALAFLEEGQGHVQTLSETFIRPETGIYSYAALLFFLEYEYYRFEAYAYPISLIIFEIQHKREGVVGGYDLLTGAAANTAAQRINLIKRPLDTLGHFETLDFALVLPNTTAASASWVANRMYESLTATPLGPKHDRNTLTFAFGIASLPADGDDLQLLVMAAKNAKSQAKEGSFPIVMSKGSKR